MATFDLARSLLSPRSGRFAFVPHSGPASFLSGYFYEDAPFDADTLTPTDSLGGVLAISDTLIATANLNETFSGDYILQTTDSLTPTTTLGIPDQTAAPLIDSLTPTAALGIPDVGAVLRDSAAWSDALSGVLHITSAFADSLALTDALGAGIIQGFNETLTPTDSLAALQTPVAWTETLTPSDTLSGMAAIHTVFSETLTLTDSLTATPLTTFTETLTASATLTGMAELYGTFAETLTPTDTLTGVVALYGSSIETLTASDTLSGSLTLLGVFTETLTAGDTLVQAQSQAVWAINAETGAVSEYVFTPTIQGLGAWRDQLYLATDDGLYALDAATDDDEAIEWAFRTGFSNLGTDALKRILDVNVLARGAGNVLLVLVADRHGQKEERRYQLVKLTANALRDQVIKAGKGIASVYWQVGCQGIGPAEIDQLRLRVEPLSRRR